MAANFIVDLGDDKKSCRTVRVSARCMMLIYEHTSDRPEELLSCDLAHFADDSRSLVIDHIALMSQVALQKFEHRSMEAVPGQSNQTISCLKTATTHFGSSSMTLEMKRMSMQIA